MTKYVYDFTEGDRDQKDLLGGKGANLAEMTKLGLPVPPGFTITTQACREYLALGTEPGELRVQVTMVLRLLEDGIGRRLGDRHDPLLVSVRSGAKFSMPGMMETVLNIGLNDASVKGLAEESGDERFAWDSYRRLLQMFGKTVLEMPGELFSDALEKMKRDQGVTSDVELGVDALKSQVARRTIQRGCQRAFRKRISPAPEGTTRCRHRGGLQFVEHRPGKVVPAPRAHPARSGDRRQHLHHGVRQPRRDKWHRCGFHP